MSEPRLIKLSKAGDYDGSSTVLAIPRNDLVQIAGGRVYTATAPAVGSVVPADFFGIFSEESPKLVGVAFSSENPRSVARVLDPSGRVREEMNLSREYQYVLMHAQDRLGLSTFESSPAHVPTTELFLEVNELSERDHMRWALAHPPQYVHTRLRLQRRIGFVESLTAPPFLPNFTWDAANNFLLSTDPADGPIPIGHLSQFPRRFGTLVSIRYSNSNNDGKVTTVDLATRAPFQLQTGLEDGRWSRTFYLAHTDMLSLSATVNPAGGPQVVCDIELMRVEPGDRLSGRYRVPEVLPAPLGHNL